ncbi:MAG: hypothetical protein ACYTEP_00340 [Planctomycetota bacterium]|jgi:hypothetical protein
MHQPLSLLAVALCLAGCVQPNAASDPGASVAHPAPSFGKTQVFVLGMIHGDHLTSETWGNEQVRATIRAIDPDVICPEIPPDRWPETIATWKERQVVEDSRVQVFPEYVDVMLPLSDEMDFAVEPSAGWSEYMAQARQAKIEEFQTADEYREARLEYAHDKAWLEDWLASWSTPASDNPTYIHSPLYDLRTKAELGPYEHHLSDVIGRPGGWPYINNDHFLLIEKAIRTHPGKRILVTFGAGHKYWFLEQLRWMPDVELMDVRPYLPGSVPLSMEQMAIDEFLHGYDALRMYWANFRGDALYALERIEGMLAIERQQTFLDSLRDTKGMFWSEFQDGPFLGPVEVVGKDAEGWHVRAAVRRLHDKPEDAQWFTATLQVDPERPGGFRWTRLSMPEWLLTREDS